jgi:HAD superfamily hydrolase (TIGR01484 family)
MRPLREFPLEARRCIRGVFTDIDDTLTRHGRLHSPTLKALEALHRTGLRVIAVTGRPTGWCEALPRQWPIDAVVAENGAAYHYVDSRTRRQHTLHYADAATRAVHRERLLAIAQRVLLDFPGTQLSADLWLRTGDVAIDIGEDVDPLPADAVVRIGDALRAQGCNVATSSIHIHAWFGDYDKLKMSRRLARELFSIDLDAQADDWVFIGDAPNDAPMFAHFAHSIGVANVIQFADRLVTRPRYVTQAGYGDGFVELADALLAAQPYASGAA